MPESDLEDVLKKKVKPIVEQAFHQQLGVTIRELNDDITERLERNPLWDFPLPTHLSFKKAKKLFKRLYLKKLLETHHGNVSMTAKIAQLARRSIHRLVSNKDLGKIRQELPLPYQIKVQAVGTIIGEVLESYKQIIHPGKLEAAYANVGSLSKLIVDHLPEEPLSLQDAEDRFEAAYLAHALEEHNFDVKATARTIGLRYETLLRKMKLYNIKH